MPHIRRTARAFDRWAPTYATEARDMIGRRGYSYAELAREIVAELHCQPGARLLEIGTGPATLGAEVVAVLPTATISGIDLAPGMVARAAAAGAYDLAVRADFTQLPFGNAEFDHVYTAFVVHSVLQQGRALSELARVLKPGGRGVIIDLCPVGRSPILAMALGFVHSLHREHGAPARYQPIQEYVRVALDVDDLVVRTVRRIGEHRKYQHFLMVVEKTSETQR